MRRMKATTVIFAVGFASIAQAAPSFTRSPFTQRATGSEVIVKWAASGGATVTYGPKVDRVITRLWTKVRTGQ